MQEGHTHTRVSMGTIYLAQRKGEWRRSTRGNVYLTRRRITHSSWKDSKLSLWDGYISEYNKINYNFIPNLLLFKLTHQGDFALNVHWWHNFFWLHYFIWILVAEMGRRAGLSSYVWQDLYCGEGGRLEVEYVYWEGRRSPDLWRWDPDGPGGAR